MTDILCAGVMIMDFLAENVDMTALYRGHSAADTFTVQCGGDALNQSIIASRLGKKTALLSKTGEDVFGQELVSVCRREGVDVLHVSFEKESPINAAIVLVDERGERRFVGNREASFKKLTRADFDFSVLPKAKIFSFASMFLMPLISLEDTADILRDAKSHGMMTALDMKLPKNGEKLGDILKVLQYTDFFFPNEEEAQSLTGFASPEENASLFRANGVKTCVIKCGDKGAFALSDEGAIYSPAITDTKCVDTTGAGDAFIGAFLSSYLDGLDMRECLLRANAAGAVTCEYNGAIAGLKNAEQIEEKICKTR